MVPYPLHPLASLAAPERLPDEVLSRQLDQQEHQRRIQASLNTIWLQKQQLLWQLESERQTT